MGWLKIIALLFTSLFMQIYIVPNFEIQQSFPNLILIGLVILCLTFRFSYALMWGFIGGLTLDLYSPIYFGVFTASFLLIFLSLYFIINKFFAEPVFILVILAFFIGSLLMDLFLFITTSYMIKIYLFDAFINTFLGTFLYYLFYGKLKKKESIYKMSND